MLQRSLTFLAVIAFTALSVSADAVYLKNGRQFKGTVVEESGSQIVIETSGGVMTFNRSDIDRIEKGTPFENTLIKAEVKEKDGDFFEAVKLYSDALGMAEGAAKRDEIVKKQENTIRDFLDSLNERKPLTHGIEDLAKIERFKTILSNANLLDLLQAERIRLEARTAQAHYDEAKRLRTGNNLDEAVSHYSTVLNNFPNHPLANNLERIIVDLYLEIGENAYKENLYMPSAKARAAFSEVLKRSPNHPRAMFFLGQMELDDKNYAKAKEYLTALDVSALDNREAQKRAQMLQRIETLTQTRPASAPRPVRTPEPTPTPIPSTYEKVSAWFTGLAEGAQDAFNSPDTLIPTLQTWAGYIIGGAAFFAIFFYFPLKIVVKDLPNRRVVYHNWRRIVGYTGLLGMIAYFIDRWYREEPGKRCPKCNRNINNPEIFEDYIFDKCPYCEAEIKPPFTLPDIIQQRSQMIATAKSMSTGVQDEAQREEMINMLTLIMTHARKIRASDIHIEPEEGRILVRFRVDGVITESFALDGALTALLGSCIKIVSNLNIAERRLPQDGHFRRAILGEEINVRVSTIPTRLGEKVVMRLLDQKLASVALDTLGMRNEPLEKYRRAITAPHGLILATGPTGSGKTTLHYASLQFINDGSKNIVTVEDPIEYELEGINQIQHNTKTGLTFATALRSILRQDPDVIMIGEIRDLETAEIAVNSALTGHLVFSTLHTIDTSTSISRLIDIGVDVKLVSSALLGIVAQRLVRKLCPHCKKKSSATDKELSQLGKDAQMLVDHPVYRPRGCRECMGTGYIGRTGIYELLVPDQNIRNLIETGASTLELRQASLKSGMKTLRTEGVFRIHSGVTSVEEVIRVTTEDVFADENEPDPSEVIVE